VGIHCDPATRRKLLALAGEPAVTTPPARPRRARAPKGLVAPAAALEFIVPLATVNPLNKREADWMPRYRRGKMARQAWAATLAVTVPIFQMVPPYRVTLTRVGGKAIDPDGLPASLKHCQDECCRSLGVDDGDAARVTFAYRQEPGPLTGVRVRIDVGG
jgi:hypothetical protein